MGTPRHHSIRRWIAFTAVAAAAASGFALAGSIGTFAETNPIVLAPGDSISDVSEGDATGTTVVARFTDTRHVNSCFKGDYTASIDWGDNATATSGTVDCGLDGEIGLYTVSGDHTYRDAGDYDIVVTVNDIEVQPKPSNSGKTDTATINDVQLAVAEIEQANLSGAEGKPLALSVFFSDNNPYFDSGLTASIDWGDESTGSGTVSKMDCDCNLDRLIHVTGSHVYDAPTTAGQKYTVTVTLTDDGLTSNNEQPSAQLTVKATVSDAALTAGAAKSLTAANGIVSNQALGSFIDAAGAQAEVGDFTATVNWGDGDSSAGTLVKTADGAFNVNGTHTYATGGTRTVTIAVKDEEGATANLTATVTVPVLAATGQPAGASLPLGAIGLLLMGTMAIVGGVLIPVARRRR